MTLATYTNPVLDADWADPDVTVWEDGFVLVASSFHRVPGLPVLRSADLVDWRLVAHALPDGPAGRTAGDPAGDDPATSGAASPGLSRARGTGVWAPSVRVHAGRLVVTYPDPDAGIFVVDAPAPEGPWSEPRLLLPGVGLIDPCPLWDEDGSAWLVHGWARSRSGVGNRLTLHPVDPGLTRTLGPGRTVVDGDAIPGCTTLEGPKIDRRDGWCWILAPAGGVAQGWQYAFRSRTPAGPYEHRVVLAQGTSAVNGPHQGAWVRTPAGEDWFLHFQDRGAPGRVVHLQPVTRDAEGWPVVGDDGAPVAGGRRPATAPSPDTLPTSPGHPVPDDRVTEDWTSRTLAPTWFWQDPPAGDWAELRGDGLLRLPAQPVDAVDLRAVGPVLAQRMPGRACTVATTLHWDPAPEAGRTGLVLLGSRYSWAGLETTAGGTRLVCRAGGDLGVRRHVGPAGTPEPCPDDGGRAAGTERDLAAPVPLPDGATVGLRAVLDGGRHVTWQWRPSPADATTAWRTLATTRVGPGRWVGAELGLVSLARAGATGTAVVGPLVGGPAGAAGPAATGSATPAGMLAATDSRV